MRDLSIHGPPLHRAEFITLAALLLSTVAMATDIILPSLRAIGADFSLRDDNHAQFVVTAMFVGLGVGQLFSGPLSDRYGRRPVILLGLLVFLVGCLASAFADSFELLLAGRVLQGMGLAGPRVVIVALIRDLYSGLQMARIMSVVHAVFILVPALAPALGQVVQSLAGWRAVFLAMLLIGIIALTWMACRQRETLLPEHQRTFTPGVLLAGLREVISIRSCMGFTLALGFSFAPFIAYLSVAQAVFQDVYGTGDRFPLYFGLLALSFGAVSLLNSRLIGRWGIVRVCRSAALFITVTSAISWVVATGFGGVPPLWIFLLGMLAVFLGVGALWGNANARAMEPLGHLAGIGSAVVAFLSSSISITCGGLVGQAFSGSSSLLFLAFAGFGLLTLLAMAWAESGRTATGKGLRP